jgi:hypothetical protein
MFLQCKATHALLTEQMAPPSQSSPHRPPVSTESLTPIYRGHVDPKQLREQSCLRGLAQQVLIMLFQLPSP